jgi:hypothetical protein
MRPQSGNWDVAIGWVDCDLCGQPIGGEPAWGRNDVIFAVCPLCSDALGWPYPEFDEDDGQEYSYGWGDRDEDG